jgi:hypothetical protein
MKFLLKIVGRVYEQGMCQGKSEKKIGKGCFRETNHNYEGKSKLVTEKIQTEEKNSKTFSMKT